MIARRRVNNFVDLLQVQVLTDFGIESGDRTKAYAEFQRMRGGEVDAPPEAKPFDREKFELLRKKMGQEMGKPRRAD